MSDGQQSNEPTYFATFSKSGLNLMMTELPCRAKSPPALSVSVYVYEARGSLLVDDSEAKIVLAAVFSLTLLLDSLI